MTDPGGVALTLEQTNGGRGWFGTVQVGCDYQVTPSIVIGAFADYDFSNIKGEFELSDGFGRRGEAEAVVGGGWPDRLAGVPAAADLRFRRLHSGAIQPGRPFQSHSPGSVSADIHLVEQTYDGWFLGTGYEYSIGWLPGMFWKTEYRFADYGSERVPFVTTSTGALMGPRSIRASSSTPSAASWSGGSTGVPGDTDRLRLTAPDTGPRQRLPGPFHVGQVARHMHASEVNLNSFVRL